jgi:hypothetical protein
LRCGVRRYLSGDGDYLAFLADISDRYVFETVTQQREETMKYTVVGVYDSTGEVFDFPVKEAESAADAIQIAASDCDYDKDLQIIGAIAADVDVIPACEEAYKSAYACDFKPEVDDDE